MRRTSPKYTCRFSITNGLFVVSIDVILSSSCFAKHDHLTRPLRSRPVKVIAGWALHPLEKRRLVTAHVETGHRVAVQNGR